MSRFLENMQQRQVFHCPTNKSDQQEELVPKSTTSSSTTTSRPEEAAFFKNKLSRSL